MAIKRTIITVVAVVGFAAGMYIAVGFRSSDRKPTTLSGTSHSIRKEEDRTGKLSPRSGDADSPPAADRTKNGLSADDQYSEPFLHSQQLPREAQYSVGGTDKGESEQNAFLSNASIEERQAFADSLAHRSPSQLLESLIDILETQDLMRRSFTADELAAQLRTAKGGADEPALRSMLGLLEDNSVAMETKKILVAVLGQAQTPAALGLLLDLAQQQQDGELRSAVLRQVADTGRERWGGPFKEELSPLLERAWRNGRNEPQMYYTLALPLARIGAPTGVALLVKTIVDTGLGVEELMNKPDPQVNAALTASTEIRNPRAIRILAKGMGGGASETSVFVSGTALASMGSVEATNVLLAWAMQADDSQAVLAGGWFSKTRDAASIELLRNTFSEQGVGAFRSQKVLDEIKMKVVPLLQ